MMQKKYSNDLIALESGDLTSNSRDSGTKKYNTLGNLNVHMQNESKE